LVDLGKIIKGNFGQPFRRDEIKGEAGTGIRCHAFRQTFWRLDGRRRAGTL